MGACLSKNDPNKKPQPGAAAAAATAAAPKTSEKRGSTLSGLPAPRAPIDIWEAAAAGRVDDVREAMRRGVGIRAANIDGQMLPHIAARHGHLPLLQLLSEHPKFDVEAQNNKGGTPLVVALEHDQRMAAQWLVEHGASLAASAPYLGQRTAFALAHELSPAFAANLVAAQTCPNRYEPPAHFRPSASPPSPDESRSASPPQLPPSVPSVTVTTTITSTTSASTTNELSPRRAPTLSPSDSLLTASRPLTLMSMPMQPISSRAVSTILSPQALSDMFAHSLASSAPSASSTTSPASPAASASTSSLSAPAVSPLAASASSSSVYPPSRGVGVRAVSSMYPLTVLAPFSALSHVPADVSAVNLSELLPYLSEPHRHHANTTFHVSKLADIAATVLPVCANSKLLHNPSALINLDASSLDQLAALSSQTFGGSIVPQSQPVWLAPSLLSHEAMVFQLDPSEIVEFSTKADGLRGALKKFKAGNPAELRFFAAEFTNLLWLSLGKALKPTQPHLALIIKVYISSLKLINIAEGVNPAELSEAQFFWAANLCYFHTFEICAYFLSAMLFTETSSERFELSVYLTNLTKGYVLSNYRLWRDRDQSPAHQQANVKVQQFSQNALKQIVVVIKQFLHCSLGGQLPDALVLLLKQIGDPHREMIERCLAAASRNFDAAGAVTESQLDNQLMRDAGELFRHIQSLPSPLARTSPLETFDMLILTVKFIKRLVASSLMASFDPPRLADRIVELIHQSCVVLELLSCLFVLQETISIDSLETMVRTVLLFLLHLCSSLCYMSQGCLTRKWLFWKTH